MQQMSVGFSDGAAAPSARAATPAPRGHAFRFFGTGSALFVLILKNVLLTLATLGVYAAWAKTERRKFMWQNTEFHGQRFVYRGTGKELFVGYLKLLLGYLVFIGLPALLRRISPVVGLAAQIVLAVALLGIIPFAIYWSRAYLLSRTSFCGVSFSLARGARPFAATFIGGYLLTLLTFGLYAPIWTNRLHAMFVNRTAFGDTAFRYDGKDAEVWRMGMKGFALTLLTAGVYYFWYLADITRYRMEHTHFGAARGRSRLTGGQLFRLGLIYILGTTLTLGLAFPWIACHALETVFDELSFEGQIDFGQIARADASESALGDGLADAMDLGLAL